VVFARTLAVARFRRIAARTRRGKDEMEELQPCCRKSLYFFTHLYFFSLKNKQQRLHGNLLPEWLHSFIERVDALETAVERPDYDELAKLFSAKNGAFGAASHAAPDLLLSQAPPEKENGPKSPAAKPKTEKKKIKKSVSPTRLPEKKKTAPASPGGPNLRPRRAGTKY
jgi:hypothetical protein